MTAAVRDEQLTVVDAVVITATVLTPHISECAEEKRKQNLFVRSGKSEAEVY